MDNNSELMDLKHGKFTNWKRKGKLSELDRLKKRQKELHIMKLSQEWDARRHKRKMDRIHFLQQRKSDQTSSQDEDGGTKTRDEGPSEKKSALSSHHTNFRTSPVSGCSSHENIYDRDTEVLMKPVSMLDEDREDENTSSLCEGSICSSSADDQRSPTSPPNQVYKSVVVKTERGDPEGFSNSNYMIMSRQLNSKNTTHISTESKKRRKKENYVVRRRTVEEHLEFNPHGNEGKHGSSAYESLVNLVNSQPPVEESCPPQSSVIAQAMRQSGLDEEDVPEEDPDEDEPALLMASEPVRFEDVLQKGGTNIQRLPTRSVDMMSNHTPPSNHRDSTDKMPAPHSRPQSRDSAVQEHVRLRKNEGLTNKAYPQIKQCYSLMGQESRSSPLPSPSSTHTGSPVATMACTSPEGNTVNTEGRHHPVAHATSTGSQSCPPSGYLVPVYKPSADEVVYAFVPNSSDRGLPGHPRPPEVVKTTGGSDAVYVPVDDRYPGRPGYPAMRPPTAVIHHGRSVRSPLERAEYPHKIVEPQPTNVTWVNVQSTAVREKHDQQSKPMHVVPTTNLRPEHPLSPTGNLHPGQHREPDVLMKPRQNPSPVVTMVNGYSSAQNPAHSNNAASSNGPGTRSSPHGNPPDTINNPTAIYVRPRLVPREIVVPYHAGSGNVPIVEYIKTDVICDKDLTNWTAQNVAEFISATDCSDSAKIFIEEDIDGKAVLLLSQDVFVNRLNLKLGTAVKLYNHVANLRSALLM